MRCYSIHYRGDERTRCEVLACAAFHVLGVLLQQPLVSISLHVGGQGRPRIARPGSGLVNQVHDEPAELGRVLDFVLRLAEDDAQHALLFAERFEHMPVMRLQFIAVASRLDQANSLGTAEGLLNGGRDCSSAILRNSRNVNCST
jgi:hypothetical protein